ncbi:hypothetical protein ASO20_02895 [Mycoplasma sp. (ex Biomphalaria glabrata)]|uniref:rRNA maturation RNase YbeY n=1 Tax=Mycoplasma sp. (ex Biomphalaria glabrata) TaxID=1749074 RepID=UPI00073A59D4|nr:rRNA maturation RNase YbeY [Mycoplasma sp. (ex Biomphalaria glabrata)]ALV23581.1 hypothetical protein ASO20_02895 [Mycoplasma sp. (ex Biomphalaria glabrata)]
MIKANFYNLTNNNVSGFKKIINNVAKVISEDMPLINGFMSIILVDSDKIQELNHTYRDKNKPTDVLSFPQESKNNKCISEELGDIFICYEEIINNCKNIGNTLHEEFRFLVVHGALHLLGYDHMTHDEEELMTHYQRKFIDKLKLIK